MNFDVFSLKKKIGPGSSTRVVSISVVHVRETP